MTKPHLRPWHRYAFILMTLTLLCVADFGANGWAKAGDVPHATPAQQQHSSASLGTANAGGGPETAPAPGSEGDFTSGQIWLAAGVLALLAALFVLLIWYSHRLEETGYLGILFKESVIDLEYKRLIGSLAEKWEKGEYYRNAELELSEEMPNPDPEIEFMASYTRLPGMVGVGGLGGSRPRPSFDVPRSSFDVDVHARGRLRKYPRRHHNYQRGQYPGNGCRTKKTSTGSAG